MKLLKFIKKLIRFALKASYRTFVYFVIKPSKKFLSLSNKIAKLGPRVLWSKVLYRFGFKFEAAKYAKGVFNDSRQTSQTMIVRRLEANSLLADVALDDLLVNIGPYNKRVAKYWKNAASRRKQSTRIALYTAISGHYDTLKPPIWIDDRIDYFLFTDVEVGETGVFQVIKLPYFDVDQTRRARYVKTHAHTLLENYDYVVWIDANLLITGDLSRYIDSFIESGLDVGGIQHPIRNTISDEALECLRAHKGNPESIKQQIEYYASINFEAHEMLETNLLMYNLRSKRTAKFLNTWWEQIDMFSNRDQLSVGYALNSSGASFHYILKRPFSTRNISEVKLVKHGHHQSKTLQKIYTDIDILHKPEIRISEQKNVSADIIYCVHNALNDVIRCLASVSKHREDNSKLIIVDDGSDKETGAYLSKFASNHGWVQLIRNEEARGYTKAANKGLKKSKADFKILLNSDTVVTRRWVSKLVRTAYSDTSIGIVGPLSSAASHQSIPNHFNKDNQTATNELPVGVTPDDMNRLCEDFSKIRGESNILVPLVHGFCFGIKKELIEKIGYFDEETFPRGYGEENDYCFRASNAGFSLAISIDTYIFHAKSKSFVSKERISLMRSGLEKNYKRHGLLRVQRAVQTMDSHPSLQALRDMASVYLKHLV